MIGRFLAMKFLHDSAEKESAVWVTIASLAVTATYSMVQNRRDHHKIFCELFEKFNKRYDDLSEGLGRVERNHDPQFIEKHRATLVRYFNLCAEEYIQYNKGYIPEPVWAAWLGGMCHYWTKQHIHVEWSRELRENPGSYYGFSAAILDKALVQAENLVDPDVNNLRAA